MTADVHISAQSLIQGGESDGERVDTFPAPEAQQRVMGEASMHEPCQDVSAAWNESKVHDALHAFLKCRGNNVSNIVSHFNLDKGQI